MTDSDPMATCEFCGGDYPQARADLGYSYCVKPACAKKGFKPAKYVEVGHNKTMAEIKKMSEQTMEELKTSGRRGR